MTDLQTVILHFFLFSLFLFLKQTLLFVLIYELAKIQKNIDAFALACFFFKR